MIASSPLAAPAPLSAVRLLNTRLAEDGRHVRRWREAWPVRVRLSVRHSISQHVAFRAFGAFLWIFHVLFPESMLSRPRLYLRGLRNGGVHSGFGHKDPIHRLGKGLGSRVCASTLPHSTTESLDLPPMGDALACALQAGLPAIRHWPAQGHKQSLIAQFTNPTSALHDQAHLKFSTKTSPLPAPFSAEAEMPALAISRGGHIRSTAAHPSTEDGSAPGCEGLRSSTATLRHEAADPS